MVNSGIKYYNQYRDLNRHSKPFFRTSNQTRVVESAENFTQGYHRALIADKNATITSTLPYPLTLISEADGSNNRLSHGLCIAFEKGSDANIANDAQAKWQAIFTPPIVARLNQDLPGANLSALQTINLMDLCFFNVVASSNGSISPFCALFSNDEWHEYEYYESLGKYYGLSNDNPLGPTQGAGFTNELIARITGQYVQDHTSVNHTLGGSNATFPIDSGHVLYADFSHDK